MPLIPFDYPAFEFNQLAAFLEAVAVVLGVAAIVVLFLLILDSSKRKSISFPLLFVTIGLISGSVSSMLFTLSFPENERGHFGAQYTAWSDGYDRATEEWRGHVAEELSRAYGLPIDGNAVEEMDYPREPSGYANRTFGPPTLIPGDRTILLSVQESTMGLYLQNGDGLQELSPLLQNEIGKVRPWR